MNNYIGELNKTEENVREELKSPLLSFKVLGAILILFTSTLVFFYFFNEQSKQLKKERESKEYFIRFIQADDKIFDTYKKWLDHK